MARRRGMTETVVGIFVLVSLLLLLVVVIFIGRRQSIFEARYEINGFFNSVGGLQTGANVQLAGINVGYVREVVFGPENRVRVAMSVNADQKQRIRADSVASIKTAGLMGERYVEITVGSENEPVIAPGGTIKTEEIFELSELLESARPTLDNLENAIRNVSLLTDRLAKPDSDVSTILRNFKVMTTDVREGKGTIGALITRDDLYERASGVLEVTQKTMDNFEMVSGNMKEASTNLPGVMADIKSSVEQLDAFSLKATEVMTEIYQLVDSGQQVMDDARTIASNLESASQDLKNATPRIGPLIESADEGVGEARKVIDAAKNSWLIRGRMRPAAPSEPIAIINRDIPDPEVVE